MRLLCYALLVMCLAILPAQAFGDEDSQGPLWADPMGGVYYEIPNSVRLQNLTPEDLEAYKVAPGKRIDTSDDEIPSTRVLIVALDKVTVGLGPKEAFPCQVKGGVGVGVPLLLVVEVEPANAAQYLVHAGTEEYTILGPRDILYAKTLANYMSTIGRALLTHQVCTTTTQMQLRMMNAEYNKFYTTLGTEIRALFAEQGITVRFVGAGGKYIVGPEVDTILREHLEVAICGELGCKPPTTLPMMAYEMVMKNLVPLAVATAGVTVGALINPIWGLLYPATPATAQ